MHYHLVTLGCQMNRSDSERVRTVLESIGFEWTDFEEQASLIGILACSVRQKAIDKVYSRIHQWNKNKNKKNLLTFVSGCLLPADKIKFLKLFDLVFTMDELPDVPDMIRQYGVVSPLSLETPSDKQLKPLPARSTSGDDPFPGLLELLQKKDSVRIDTGTMDAGMEEAKRNVMDGFWHIKPHYTSSFEAFIPIQNGCDKFCTFCAVPYTRGREVSRPAWEILGELKDLVEKGYRSITLLGQNVNSYGLDRSGNELSFPELLKEIGKFGQTSPKRFWVYFTSPHPRDMTEDVIDTIAKYDCLAKQLHLPLQSGDDKILEKMNRQHSVEKYRKIIHYIRKKLPQATLFTDIIVGFAGETDARFENTRRVMQEFKYNMAYIAIYSPRPGAVSARWQDDVPHRIKKQRLHILTADLEKTSGVYTNKMVGKTHTVLVTGQDRKQKYLSGMTEGRINVRIQSNDTSLIGSFVIVKITSATDFSAEGKMTAIEKPKEVVS